MKKLLSLSVAVMLLVSLQAQSNYALKGVKDSPVPVSIPVSEDAAAKKPVSLIGCYATTAERDAAVTSWTEAKHVYLYTYEHYWAPENPVNGANYCVHIDGNSGPFNEVLNEDVAKPFKSCTKTLYGSNPWTGYATQQAAYEGATSWLQGKTDIISEAETAYEYPVDGYTYWRVLITYTAPSCY